MKELEKIFNDINIQLKEEKTKYRKFVNNLIFLI